MKTSRMLITVLFISVFSSFSASPVFSDSPKPDNTHRGLKGSGLPGKTVFDLAHAEIFSPVKTGPLHYSSFYKRIKRSGEDVYINTDPVTSKSLEGVDTYIIAGPSMELAPDEIAALKDFVNNGGNLLVLLHISGPVARLTENFGIIVSNFVISERDGAINGQSQDFYVTRFSKHPVTDGLKKIAVFGTWGIMARDGARLAAVTSEKAWADINRNRTFEEGEPVQSFGIVAVNEFGKGKVVVVADDAPFANRFIGEADNKKFAENVIRWFKR